MAIRVLVIDDSRTVLYRVCQLLEGIGMEPPQARSPIDALTDHLVDGHDIDVVITDLLFPGPVPGEYLIQMSQRHPSLGLVPVIVLTTFSEKAVQLRCIDLGAAAFFAKPWDDDILIGTVRMLATQFQRRRAARAATPAT
jgi:CheY-like chemotaxis protein